MHFQENLIKMASIKEQLRRVEEGGGVIDPKLTPHEESQKIAELLNEYENLHFKNQQLLGEAGKTLRPIETVNKKRLAQKYKEKRYTAENDYLIYAYIDLDHPHRCYVGQTLQSRASQRDQDHRKGKSGSPYFNAFVQHEIIYGKKNFDDVLRYEVLEKFRGTANKCAEKEDEHIQRKNSIENGWNLLKSGVRNKHTETQKENNRKNNPAKASNHRGRGV